MSSNFSRTEMLIGKDGMKKISKAKVAIFGIGGVGSFVVEGLVRAGIQNFILVDNDIVCESNLELLGSIILASYPSFNQLMASPTLVMITALPAAIYSPSFVEKQ